jgi:signal transduction histidine kinase
MEALPILERRNEEYKLMGLYCYMSSIYQRLGLGEKALEYAEKAVAIDPEDPYALMELGEAQAYLQQYEKENEVLKEVLRISEQRNSRYLSQLIYFRLGDAAIALSDFNTAEKYLRQSLEICKEIGAEHSGHLLLLSKLEQMKGNYVQSEELALEALQFATDNDFLELKRFCYRVLSELSVVQHKYKESMRYWMEMDGTEMDMDREHAVRASEEMAAKYETEKKELKISALEEERRLMFWLGIAGGVVLLLALLAFILLWRGTVQKRRFAEQQRQLAEQQIKQLEQEQQLIATQSVLDGETHERSRLAKDLHDGLGSMLTGVKLNLQEVKGGVKLKSTEVETFNKAMKLLDESVQEMRRISHHLMPDSLNRFGLKSAVNDFCRSLSANIVFDYYGDETRLDPRLEVVIYRCIHELVNNALKYSGASQIMVQIMQEPNRIAFTVEDNGCGFDTQSPTKGMGLQNIRTRIAAYNGNLFIDSRIGEGTEVNGELRIEN